MDARRKRILAIALAASQHLLQTVIHQGCTLEDDGQLINPLVYLATLIQRQLRGKRRLPTRIRGYVDHTIPHMIPSQFREHFRLTPEAFHNLENLLGPLLSKNTNIGRTVIPVRKQLLVTLWLLATPDSYRSVGDRFDMGKASANGSFMRVVESLCSIADRIIQWPNEQEARHYQAKFFSIAKLPDVIGAIDGSDVEIKAPKIEPHAYTNRKKRYAIILQAVCNSELKFLDCFAGFPGSVGDLRVLRNSPLWRRAGMEEARMFPANGYIIGDKIYPCLPWLIPSFRDRGTLTEQQKNFNKVHASTRQVIERAFALLKGRFRRLKYLDMNRIDMIPYVILACCVLHNICLNGVNERYEDFIGEGLPHANLRGDAELNEQVEDAGEAKRNYLVTRVPQVL